MGTLDTQAAVALDTSARASRSARDSCQVLMHEDADAFVQCADTLLRNSPTRTLEQRHARLGVSYYAWLSATSAAKNGLPGAAAAAEHFILIFRPLQRQLRVDDDALCKTIEGDCIARNARMLITEKEARDRTPIRQGKNTTGTHPPGHDAPLR